MDSDAIVLIGPSDRFDFERAVWCGRVMNDRRLDATTRFVAWHIGQHVNRYRGYAWTSTAFLADLGGVKKRRIQQILTRLAELKIIAREKVGRAFRYRMIDIPGPKATPIPDFPDPTAKADDMPIAASAPPAAEDASRTQGVSLEGGSRTQGHSESRTEGTSIYLNTDLSEEDDLSDARARPRAETEAGGDLFGIPVAQAPQRSRKRQPRPSDPPTAIEQEAFAVWFAGFPRHIDRQNALKAYVRAVRRGIAPQLLLERRDAYAALVRRQGRQSEHILHPTTWLNGARWEDEIPAETDRHGGRSRPGRSWADMALEKYGPAKVLQ